MITRTMTWDEIKKEIHSDIKESNIHRRVYAQIEQKMKKYRRAIIQDRYYFFTPIKIESNRHNTYYCMPFSSGKSYFKKELIRYNIVTFVNRPDGNYVVAASKESISGYSYHLIHRYYERFEDAVIDQDNFRISALKFCVRNDVREPALNPSEKYGENAIFSTCVDGVLLGHLVDDTLVYRTYLSYDMLRGEQIETVENMVPEMLENMAIISEMERKKVKRYKMYRRLVA